LQSAQAEWTSRFKRLKDALAAETERREAIKRRGAEHAQRRGELEAALAQNELIKRTLQLEVEASDSAKRRASWRPSWPRPSGRNPCCGTSWKMRKKQLRTEREKDAEGMQARLEAQAKELQAAHAEAEQQVNRLTETLAEETKRREGAEQQAAEIAQRRSELEGQLGRLSQQLEEAQRQQDAELDHSRTEKSRIEARTRELQATHAEVEAQAQELTKALAEEARRREGAKSRRPGFRRSGRVGGRAGPVAAAPGGSAPATTGTAGEFARRAIQN